MGNKIQRKLAMMMMQQGVMFRRAAMTLMRTAPRRFNSKYTPYDFSSHNSRPQSYHWLNVHAPAQSDFTGAKVIGTFLWLWVLFGAKAAMEHELAIRQHMEHHAHEHHHHDDEEH